MSRFTAATGLVLLVTTALVGCTPAAEPEPEWTEESAYAAAEETFRAYWAAGAIGSDKSEEKQYITGDLLAHYERSPQDSGTEDSIEVRGESKLGSFVHDEYRVVGEAAVVEARVCVDDSDFQVNVDGNGWESPREDPIYTVSMRFMSVGGTMLLANLDESDDDVC
ncbi:hypothetical protein GCM10010910_07860 [Microbacterium nanhaiense]|uniref:Lipoprotein n=1 Tax=Microbacterium nanhaiense TaxID=1301026 RepID=A0ABQ2MZR0_9MICO|nr:hypothetical protein [Microbacterium nanhaiense]GGO61029.1 hypothetical protein GCM10010910_07860 [Microbacterium nanhaiense]